VTAALSLFVQHAKTARHLSRFAGVRVRRRRMPRQQQPNAIRIAYAQAIKSLLKRAEALVNARLVPLLPSLVSQAAAARGDARLEDSKSDYGFSRKDAPEDVNDMVDALSEQLWSETSNQAIGNVARSFAYRTADFQKEQLQRQLRAATGIDVPVGDARLGPIIQQHVAENVALIKSVPDEYFSRIERSVMNGVRSGKRADEISSDLQEQFDIEENRADLISNDQVGKIFGDVNQARQEELGIDGYVWRTAGDERVRDEHAAREGQRFTWDDPPEDGHPSDAVNCRCVAEPDLSGILGDL
jgi:SPP1 gp7 family putative phage head morphogenesis protein